MSRQLTGIGYAEEQLVVAGRWRGKRRCQRIGEAAYRCAKRELGRLAKQ